MTPSPLTPIQVTGVSAAILLLAAARSRSVSATYHPRGGHAPSGYIVPTHTVWMTCDVPSALKIQHDAEHPLPEWTAEEILEREG